MEAITGKPILLYGKKEGAYIFPFTNNIPKDSEPILSSKNFLDSGTIYNALTYKANLNHVHQIQNVENLQNILNEINLLNGGTISGTTSYKLSNIHDVSIVPTDPQENISHIILDGNGVRIGEILARNNTDGSVEMRFALASNLRNNNPWRNLIIGTDLSGNTYTYSPHPPFSSYDTNIATTKWVRDYVENKIFANAAVDITSAWSTGEWTNNLSDGILCICIKQASNKRITFYGNDLSNSQIPRIIFHSGIGAFSGPGSISNAYSVYVKKDKVYYLTAADVLNENTSNRSGAENTKINPEWVYFYDITNN